MFKRFFIRMAILVFVLILSGLALADNTATIDQTSPNNEADTTQTSTSNQEPEPAEPVIKPKAKTKIVEDAQDIEGINGLIIERTMTKIGYEFYENFYTFWEALEGLPKEFKDYNISISERANPTWGSWIQVKVSVKITPTIVWSRVVRPRSEEVEESAGEAVEATKNYLYRYEEYREALESSDMAGDGIY